MAVTPPPHPSPLPPEPVGTTGVGPVPAPPGYPVEQTVISQYSNSPILLQLIENMAEYFDPTVRLNDFYNLVWNIDSAVGWGLDVWGRILGVGRVLHIPVPGDYLGFDQASDAFTFGFGIWYGAGVLTENYYLTDDVYRRLLLAKALANISDGSVPAINQILINLFPDYPSNKYVIDNLDMTMTYRFEDTLSPPDVTLAQDSGVLPKPAGVSADFAIG